MSTQYAITGRSAHEIAASIEDGVREGALPAGTRLPAVRDLARRLGVSPGTVASAYAALRRRGIVATGGRRGTHVRPRPAVTSRTPAHLPVPPGARDLSTGEPNVDLLPPLGPVLRTLAPPPTGYRTGGLLPAFAEAAKERLARDGVPAHHVTATNGGLDGIERALAAHVAPGDAVAVEDPGWSALLDLLAAMNLRTLPVPVDDDGPTTAGVERALRQGAAALVVTARAQNPTGAAVSAERAQALRTLLSDLGSGRHRGRAGSGGAGRPSGGVLVIEDDHAAELSAEPLHTLAGATPTWAFVRSVSKPYGPDLRCAVLAADEETHARVEGRHALAARWVSTVLQSLVVALWTDPATDARVAEAGRHYDERRQALVDALAERGVTAHGRSGLNVWIPVGDETTACARLSHAGWVVAPGSRFRIGTPPGIRLTISTLERREVTAVADAVADALRPAAPGPAV